MNCKKCGNELCGQEKFCIVCGKKIDFTTDGTQTSQSFEFYATKIALRSIRSYKTVVKIEESLVTVENYMHGAGKLKPDKDERFQLQQINSIKMELTPIINLIDISRFIIVIFLFSGGLLAHNWSLILLGFAGLVLYIYSTLIHAMKITLNDGRKVIIYYDNHQSIEIESIKCLLEERESNKNREYKNSKINSGTSDINPSKVKPLKGKRKNGNTKIVIWTGMGTVIFLLMVIAFLWVVKTGRELSNYIPLARADVIKFAEDNNLEEIMDDFMYENEDLMFTLNDNGNIDMLIIETPRYSLFGMKIGNEFTLEKDGRRLTEHNYGLLGEYGDRIVYGAVSDVDNSGGDRMIAITLDSAGIISKLEFMITDIQDILDAESEGVEIEDTEIESYKSEYEPSTKELSQYLLYNQEQLEPLLDEEKMEVSKSDPNAYTNGRIVVIFDYEGNVNHLSIASSEYTLYDIQVGQEFKVSDYGKLLSQGYQLNGNDREGDDYTVIFASSEKNSVIGITTNEGTAVSILYYINDESVNDIIEESASDYIFSDSDKRVLNNSEIGRLSDYEKSFAMFEILARHGAIFLDVEDGEYIQSYFDSQDWYTPLISVMEIDEDDLNLVEAENIYKISEAISVEPTAYSESTAYEANDEDCMVLPESNSRHYNSYELSEFSKEELRLARNEIYARHGRMFETEDLNQYFSSQPWYYGYLTADEFDESVFNQYEKANLDTIKAVESGTINNLPEYITGDTEQLGLMNIINVLYVSDNGVSTMEIGEYSGTGETYVNFFQGNNLVWVGTADRYQVLPNGGLGIVFTGDNYMTGEADYMSIEWTTFGDKKSPSVFYEFDTIGLSGSYTYDKALYGN